MRIRTKSHKSIDLPTEEELSDCEILSSYPETDIKDIHKINKLLKEIHIHCQDEDVLELLINEFDLEETLSIVEARMYRVFNNDKRKVGRVLMAEQFYVPEKIDSYVNYEAFYEDYPGTMLEGDVIVEVHQ